MATEHRDGSLGPVAVLGLGTVVPVGQTTPTSSPGSASNSLAPPPMPVRPPAVP